jgi:hypothetical protein
LRATPARRPLRTRRRRRRSWFAFRQAVFSDLEGPSRLETRFAFASMYRSLLWESLQQPGTVPELWHHHET